MASFTPDQIATLKQLHYPTDQGSLNRLDGNGRLQQYLNQQASVRGLTPPFSNSAGGALFQDILPLAVLGISATLPEDAGAGAAAGGAGATGGGVAASQVGKRAALATGVAGAGLAITDTKDFFNLISWLFHPLNWLRMVEFLTGMLFLYFGLRASFRAFGRSSPGPVPFRRVASWTPLGRGMRMRQGRRSAQRRVGYDRERERLNTQ